MYFVNIHTHSSNRLANEIAVQNLFPEQNEQMNFGQTQLYSVGLHPWYTEKIKVNELAKRILGICENKNVIAVGEIGIDKNRGAEIDIQLKLFETQAQIGNELNKPVIIHCVKGFNEILSLRKKLKPKVDWIFHGFVQNAEIAKQCIDLGCKLSFGKALLNTGSSVRSVFQSVPDESYFIETDEGNSIEEIYQAAAQIKNISIQKLQEIQWLNFNECFKVQQNEYIQRLDAAYRAANRSK